MEQWSNTVIARFCILERDDINLKHTFSIPWCKIQLHATIRSGRNLEGMPQVQIADVLEELKELPQI